MNRIRSASLVAAAALAIAPVATTLAPTAALASYSGTTGRIVFDGIVNTGHTAIFSVNPDGSDLQQLTAGTGEDLGPDVSADGSKIVYSTGADNDHAELWVMNADGSNQHQLTSDGSRDWYPSWSPDGGTIAFRSDKTGNGDVYTIPAAGGTETQLTSAAGLDSVPEYSPDGTKILFHSTREDPNPATCTLCTEGVYVMNADGSNQTKLFGAAPANGSSEQDRFPSWSPDGSRIVFNRAHVPNSDPADGIYLADADGSNVTRVNGPGTDAQEADFSNDGQSIAFEEGGYVMKTVPTSGGIPRTIVTSAETRPQSIDWSTIAGTHPPTQTPTVSNVAPSAGPTAGGTSVTVTGTHLLGAAHVYFGTVEATDVSVTSDVQLTAITPAGSAGQVDVTVTNSAGTSATGSADLYTYDATAAAPTVTGISPTSGSTSGGTSVVLTGTGLAGVTGVTFGTTPAASFTQDSDSQITAVSPAGTGTVDVTATTPNGITATSAADHFSYSNPASPAPRITGVSPAKGPRSGGTTVTLTGSGFTGATQVTVGGANASFHVVSNTRMTLQTPASATVGARQVRVTNAGGTSPTGSASTFTYGNPPTVTKVSPASGSPSGGTVTTLTGSGFTAATAVHFGNALGTRVHVASATRITVTSPAGRGTVDVRVTGPFGTSAAVGGDRFRYATLARR